MRKTAKRRTDALSRELIVATAIEILDADGEEALTFRALADRLSTGAGALYHHIASKNELLAAATEAVISEALDRVSQQADPRESIRAVALSLWESSSIHPWIGPQFSSVRRLYGIARLFEAIGSHLDALGVPAAQQLSVTAAFGSNIIGAVTQESANSRLAKSPEFRDTNREEYLTSLTEQWRDLDGEQFPFVHRVLDEFPHHDDREQFLTGVDLMLAGLDVYTQQLSPNGRSA